MIVLANAHVVLPDRILSPGAVLLDGDRILDVVSEAPAASPGDLRLDLQHHTIVPGFIDVHVHGVEGSDSLDGAGAIAPHRRGPASLWRHRLLSDVCGVRDPEALRTMLTDVRSARLGAAIGVIARSAGASREQLHQSRLSRRSTVAVFALARRRGSRRGVQRRRNPRGDSGGPT